jgi:hypothetical protein
MFPDYVIVVSTQVDYNGLLKRRAHEMCILMKWVLLLVGIAVSILIGQQMSGAETVTLQDIRWQPLPQTIRGVFVAPDGRIWYHEEPRSDRYSTVVDLKQMIASEFQQPTPQIEVIEPALFEPSGRVWFTLRRASHSMLVGYDGKTWTDYTIADDTNCISGECATDGRLNEGRANRFAGGAAWFIMVGGVLRFDGQHWSYQKMQDCTESYPASNNWRYHDKVWLAVSPDGKAAIACVSIDKFWIYREGQWTQRAIKEPQDAKARHREKKELTALVLDGPETAWYQTSAGELRQICLVSEAKHEETPGVATLIEDLRNDSFNVRERAAEKLRGLGATIRPQLESAFECSDDLEQRTRLQSLLVRISSSETANDPKKDMVFNAVHFNKCESLYDDGFGRIFVVASTSDRNEADLIIIKDHDGKITKMQGEHFSAGWSMRLNSNKAPILSSTGNRIWLPGDDAEAPKLLDLKAMEFMDAVPHPTYGELHAVSREGRVFVSAPGSSANPILVYSPEANATEDSLKHSCIDCLSDLFAIGDDGAVWATDPSGRLVRFNGFQWNPVQGSTHNQINSLIPGHDDVLIACGEKTAAIYQGTQEIGIAEITELIEQHRDLVQKAFGPRSGIRHRVQYNQGLVADRNGNIWFVQPRGRLLVYMDGAWHDTNESLAQGGASEGLVASLALLGDGSSVLVDELKLRRCDASSALFGHVADGKLQFVKAPENCRFGEIPLNVAARDGAIWMPSYTAGQHGASRADEIGVREDIKNVGYPLLFDEAGNLWTVELRSGARDQLNVCRDGKVVQHLQIPQLTDAGFLISDRPGSVYARTTLGLQHLIADGPNFLQYRLEKLYALEGIPGDRLGQLLNPYPMYGYSKYGYLVVPGSFATNRNPEHKLYLIKLPVIGSPP